jgi:uncharacterized protein (DUF1697 family)
MKTLISLLRGINVNGKNKIPMKEIKGVYESLGLVNVETYIQTGNVIFDYTDQDPVKLTNIIETEITRFFATTIMVLLRDIECFQQIVSSNPFLTHRHVDSTKLHVTFLHDSPDESAFRKLTVPVGISDEYELSDKEIYLYCLNGYGKTKFSNTYFERKLGVGATTRNWKTVESLYRMANKR